MFLKEKKDYNRIFEKLDVSIIKRIKESISNLVIQEDIDILDEINFVLNEEYRNSKIFEEEYEIIMGILDDYYKEDYGYSKNRYKWIRELKEYDFKITLNQHHNELLQFFVLINKILSEGNIGYFHASGFMGYILVNKKLERYHHDIDLYIDIKDINKLVEAFSYNDFIVEHTFEKANDLYRHGLKINHKLINIPIWLSFYEITNDNAMNINEYYEDKDGNMYTSKNYNSPLCCKLSLCDGVYDQIPFVSMSLDSIYCSKIGNREKDIYDCSIIEENVDKEKVKIIKTELSDKFNFYEEISYDMMRIFDLSNSYKVKELK